MDWYQKMTTGGADPKVLDTDFENLLFSALRAIEQSAKSVKDPAEKELLSKAYDAIWQAYNIRAGRADKPPLGWASQSGGWGLD